MGSLGSLASTIDRVGSYAQQAWDFAQSGIQGIQAAQQFAGALGLGRQPPAAGATPRDAGQPAGVDGLTSPTQPAPPAGQPPAGGAWPAVEPIGMAQPFGVGAAGQPAAGFDQIAMLLQALRQRQIPPLPGPATQPPGAPPVAAPMPMMAAAPPQPDALGLLRLILTNPQLQQALQSAPSMGAALPRTVALPVPAPAAPRQIRSVPIPLAAVMNAIFALAGQSMTELNESTSEDDPEIPAYLVADDGDFLVDPASPDDRAALVAHLFRLSDEARRSGRFPPLNSRPGEADGELDECDRWARDAGFL